MKNMMVSIQKCKHGDFTNNGASSKYDEMHLLWDEKLDVPKEEDVLNFINFYEIEPEQILILVKRTLWGKDHWFARPFLSKKGLGPMAGGNKAILRDEDSQIKGQLSIHDRWESQEVYDLLSE